MSERHGRVSYRLPGDLEVKACTYTEPGTRDPCRRPAVESIGKEAACAQHARKRAWMAKMNLHRGELRSDGG